MSQIPIGEGLYVGRMGVSLDPNEVPRSRFLRPEGDVMNHTGNCKCHRCTPRATFNYSDDVAGPDVASDTQEGGSHYRDMAIQPIEFIDANKLDYFQGNVIKYVCRHASKNGAEDIRKAIHYCRLILEYQYGEK